MLHDRLDFVKTYDIMILISGGGAYQSSNHDVERFSKNQQFEDGRSSFQNLSERYSQILIILFHDYILKVILSCIIFCIFRYKN